MAPVMAAFYALRTNPDKKTPLPNRHVPEHAVTVRSESRTPDVARMAVNCFALFTDRSASFYP